MSEKIIMRVSIRRLLIFGGHTKKDPFPNIEWLRDRLRHLELIMTTHSDQKAAGAVRTTRGGREQKYIYI
jgi:hypothetical protein